MGTMCVWTTGMPYMVSNYKSDIVRAESLVTLSCCGSLPSRHLICNSSVHCARNISRFLWYTIAPAFIGMYSTTSSCIIFEIVVSCFATVLKCALTFYVSGCASLVAS